MLRVQDFWGLGLSALGLRVQERIFNLPNAIYHTCCQENAPGRFAGGSGNMQGCQFFVRPCSEKCESLM